MPLLEAHGMRAMSMPTDASPTALADGSDSKTRDLCRNGRPKVVVCCLLAMSTIFLVCAVAELGAGFLLDHSGLTQRRINSELPVVLQLRPGTGGKTTVLMVGSSQMLEGIKLGMLSSDLGPNYEVAPLLIEATSYYDWYFGLKRLFHGGARPDVVLLGLSAPVFLETQVRPEYFSQTLLDRRDLGELKQDLHLSEPATISMRLGMISRFWGNRDPIREKLFSVIFPHYDPLQEKLNTHHQSPADDRTIRAVVPGRIAQLQQICQQYGARLIVVLPPVGTGIDYFEAFRDSAAKSGVSVLLPIHSDTLSADSFSDGKHLTPARAVDFTHATANALLEVLAAAK